jgi:hypothetical protein
MLNLFVVVSLLDTMTVLIEVPSGSTNLSLYSVNQFGAGVSLLASKTGYNVTERPWFQGKQE